MALKHRDVSATALDVTDRDAVDNWALESAPSDTLFDCPGISPFDGWNDGNWHTVARRVFEVNLHGPLNLARAFINQILEDGSNGRIIFGSIAGQIGRIAAFSHYAM